MVLTPTPPVDAPQWWEIVAALNPLAVLLAAIIAGAIAWRALRQRSIADRRSEWWARARWALDASLSDDNARRTMGMKVLQVLASSKLARNEELDVLNAAWTKPLASYLELLDTSAEPEDNGHTDERRADDEGNNSGDEQRPR